MACLQVLMSHSDVSVDSLYTS